MTAKVATRDLYRLLREGCGGRMKALGFGRLAGTSLGWTRREGDLFVSIWFQAARNGWMDGFGSRFTFEFQLDPEAAVGAGQIDRRRRYMRLLNSDERELVREWNDDILARLPGFAANPAREAMLKDMHPSMVEMYRNSCQPSTAPYPPGVDVWLRYYEPPDVERWAAWIAESMKRTAVSS